MLGHNDKEVYYHNRAVYGKDHDFIVGELQISKKAAERIKSDYEHWLIKFKAGASYRVYCEYRDKKISAEDTAVILKLTDWLPEQYEVAYREDKNALIAKATKRA